MDGEETWDMKEAAAQAAEYEAVNSIVWLECPFCGSEELSQQSMGGIFWINCDKCSTSGPPKFDVIEAIGAWNKRHSNDPDEA